MSLALPPGHADPPTDRAGRDGVRRRNHGSEHHSHGQRHSGTSTTPAAVSTRWPAWSVSPTGASTHAALPSVSAGTTGSDAMSQKGSVVEKVAHRKRCPRSVAIPVHNWEMNGKILPMETTIDSVGRIVVPKPLRDALGLLPGSTVDISRYGAGLQLVPTGRTARLVDESGTLVATGDTTIDDDVVFGLIDTGRR